MIFDIDRFIVTGKEMLGFLKILNGNKTTNEVKFEVKEKELSGSIDRLCKPWKK